MNRVEMGDAAVLRWAGSIRSPPTSSEAQRASKSCSTCQQKRQSRQVAMWQVPWGEGPEQSQQERLMLAALGSYKCNRHELGLGVAAGADAHARVLQKKPYCTSLDGWPSFLQTKEHPLEPMLPNPGQRYSPRVPV